MFGLFGGLAGLAATEAAVKAPGKVLKSKFVSLGKLKGRTYNEIVETCGQPSAVSAMGNGTVLKQWQATSYNIALLFDAEDICLGVTSEISV